LKGKDGRLVDRQIAALKAATDDREYEDAVITDDSDFKEETA
jgi:hypothetical protein